MKAYLVSKGIRFRKVHNLTYLMDLCKEEGLSVDEFQEDVSRLSPFAVDERYPGARREPPAELVEEFVEIVENLFTAITRELDAKT